MFLSEHMDMGACCMEAFASIKQNCATPAAGHFPGSRSLCVPPIPAPQRRIRQAQAQGTMMQRLDVNHEDLGDIKAQHNLIFCRPDTGSDRLVNYLKQEFQTFQESPCNRSSVYRSGLRVHSVLHSLHV